MSKAYFMILPFHFVIQWNLTIIIFHSQIYGSLGSMKVDLADGVFIAHSGHKSAKLEPTLRDDKSYFQIRFHHSHRGT